jgi:hypothetical protein
VEKRKFIGKKGVLLNQEVLGKETLKSKVISNEDS